MGLKNWKVQAEKDIELAREAASMVHHLEGYEVLLYGQPMTNIFRFVMTRDAGIDHAALCA